MTLSPDVVAAFFAGIASIFGAGWAIRKARREEQDRCDQRVKEIREVYDRGLKEGLHMSERDA